MELALEVEGEMGVWLVDRSGVIGDLESAEGPYHTGQGAIGLFLIFNVIIGLQTIV